MAEIDIFTEGGVRLPYKGTGKAFLRKTSQAILALINTGSVHINIILSDNEFIREINRSYREKDYPTDVISFAYREEPFPDAAGGPEELGDIYISLEKALEQSAEYGVSFRDELKRLLVHGILHLTGYDHERSAEDEKIMETEEERILGSL
ncbi:MAG TPA: rRNA maturation RNase YbeY [Spirochaetota bacterium]|nr:rRNA maturation RNase YbeY [Spirochaetota bacterium]